jgi:hypothetical protein
MNLRPSYFVPRRCELLIIAIVFWNSRVCASGLVGPESLFS